MTQATAFDFEQARARLAASSGYLESRFPKTPPPSPARRTRTPHVGLKGSRLPDDVQEWVRAELAGGASLNGLANALGVSRDAIRVVRDGVSVRQQLRYASRAAS